MGKQNTSASRFLLRDAEQADVALPTFKPARRHKQTEKYLVAYQDRELRLVICVLTTLTF